MLGFDRAGAGGPIRAALVGAVASIAVVGGAQAAFVANATTATGIIEYVGLGETSPGSNIGTGRVIFGDCSFDGVNTVCVSAGRYEEDGSSSNAPGATGDFVLTQTYSGNGVSPAIGQSTEPFGDIFTFIDLGGAIFELTVTPDGGSAVSGIFPAVPFANSIGFFGEFDPATVQCEGLSSAVSCSVGQVGLASGARIFGSYGGLGFAIPSAVFDNMSAIPLPGAAALFLGALTSAAGASRLRRAAR